MSRILYVFVLSLFFVNYACNDKKDQEEETIANIVEIRIKNGSEFDYEGLRVEIGTTESVYGDIAAGESTDYKTFDYAYSYSFVELTIDSGLFTIQPIDFLGETKLDPGKYTYEINAGTTGTQYDRLSINLIVD